MPDVLECRKNVQKEECAIKRNKTDPRDRQYEPDPSEQAQKRRKKAKKPNRGLRVAAVLLTIGIRVVKRADDKAQDEAARSMPAHRL